MYDHVKPDWDARSVTDSLGFTRVTEVRSDPKVDVTLGILSLALYRTVAPYQREGGKLDPDGLINWFLNHSDEDGRYNG